MIRIGFDNVAEKIQPNSYNAGFRGGMHIQQISPKNKHPFATKIQQYAKDNKIGVIIPMTNNASQRFNFKK